MSPLGTANSLTLTRIQGTLKDFLAYIHEYRGCFAIKTRVLVKGLSMCVECRPRGETKFKFQFCYLTAWTITLPFPILCLENDDK